MLRTLLSRRLLDPFVANSRKANQNSDQEISLNTVVPGILSMEMINGTFFFDNSVSEEEVQSFLDEQDRLLERPIILKRVHKEKGTDYVTGRILDDILGNLEYWSEFKLFEDALEETEKFKNALKEKEQTLRQIRNGAL